MASSEQLLSERFLNPMAVGSSGRSLALLHRFTLIVPTGSNAPRIGGDHFLPSDAIEIIRENSRQAS